MRRLAFACLLALCAAASACKGSCRQLAEQLCNCASTQADRDACNQNVANEDGRIGPTSQDNATCAQLIPNCDCHLVNTPQGKVACGLARDAGAAL
jgi:hypothetical protein